MFEEKILDILENSLKKYDFNDDKEKIQYLYDAIKKIKIEVPTIEVLEKLKKIEIDLEVKYECFYELNNFFDPIYIKLKKSIHENKIKKLREENRKKKGG